MKRSCSRLFYAIGFGVLITFSMGISSSACAEGSGSTALSWAEWFSAHSRIAVLNLASHSYDTEKPSAKACITVDSVRAINEFLSLVNHHNEALTTWFYNGGWLVYDVAMLTQHIKALAERGDGPAAAVDAVALLPETAGRFKAAIDWLSWGLPWVEYLTSVCIASVTSDETTTYRVRLQSIISLSRMLQVWIAQRHTPREQLCGLLVAAHFVLTVSEFFRDYNPSTTVSLPVPSGSTVIPVQQSATTPSPIITISPTTTVPADDTKTSVVVVPTQTVTTVVDKSAETALGIAVVGSPFDTDATVAVVSDEKASNVEIKPVAQEGEQHRRPLHPTFDCSNLHGVARLVDPQLPPTPQVAPQTPVSSSVMPVLSLASLSEEVAVQNVDSAVAPVATDVVLPTATEAAALVAAANSKTPIEATVVLNEQPPLLPFHRTPPLSAVAETVVTEPVEQPDMKEAKAPVVAVDAMAGEGKESLEQQRVRIEAELVAIAKRFTVADEAQKAAVKAQNNEEIQRCNKELVLIRWQRSECSKMRRVLSRLIAQQSGSSVLVDAEHKVSEEAVLEHALAVQNTDERVKRLQDELLTGFGEITPELFDARVKLLLTRNYPQVLPTLSTTDANAAVTALQVKRDEYEEKLALATAERVALSVRGEAEEKCEALAKEKIRVLGDSVLASINESRQGSGARERRARLLESSKKEKESVGSMIVHEAQDQQGQFMDDVPVVSSNSGDEQPPHIKTLVIDYATPSSNAPSSSSNASASSFAAVSSVSSVHS